MSRAIVGYEAEHGVGRIVLDQVAKHNAITLSMWSSLPALVSQADADPSVRVITLSGAGDKAFCAGADISEFAGRRSAQAGVDAYGAAVAAGYRAVQQASKPTVALMRGICFGGGLALAMNCDIRLGATGARFRIPAGRLGLGYDYGSVLHLIHRLGPGAVADILFSARTLTAEDAHACGILQRLFDAETFDTDAAAYVTAIADNAPLTLAAIKRALLEAARPEAERDPAAVHAMVQACFASTDYQEGQAAFKAKRCPAFTGR